MAEDPFAKIVQDWQDANPTVRPKTKQPSSATTIISQNPRTTGTVAGAYYAGSKAVGAYRTGILEATQALRARGVEEVKIAKELTKLGFDVTSSTPTGGKALADAGRAIASDSRLGYLPWGKGYENSANLQRIPQLTMKGREALPYTTDAGAPTRLVSTAESAVVDAKKLAQAVADGKITPEQALKFSTKGLQPAVADPTSRWVKAGRGYKAIMGGSQPVNSMASVRSGFRGNKIPMAMAGMELGGAVYDVVGTDGVWNSEYMKQVGNSKDPLIQGLGGTLATLKSAKRVGRGAGEALTFGGLGMSGVPDWEERRDAINNAHRIFREEKAKVTGDSSKSHPVELTHTGVFHDNHGLTQNTNEKGNELFKAVESSPRFKAIYSKELARLGVPESMWTPDVYKGPEHEYSIDMNDNIKATPFGSALERQQTQIAFEDASLQNYNNRRSVLNVDPSAGPMGWSTIRGTDPRDLGLNPDAGNYSTDGYIR
jgi:hypothetical protein